jgi:Cu(I)/Ag(I) efflux system membrane fusion protein
MNPPTSRFSFLRHGSAGRFVLPLLIAGVFFLGWYVGLPPAQEENRSESATTWTCSMHPQIRQPNPGLCPICAMALIPLDPNGGSDGGLREVSVSTEAAALMDLRVSPVLHQAAAVHVDLFGKIAYDERNVTTTTARIGGRLDRFYIDYTGTEVRKGDHIAEIYSPELIVAQQDLIKAIAGVERSQGDGTEAAVETQQRLLRSARERLRLLQLTETQIDAIEKQGKPTDTVTLFAPQDGVVTKRHVVEGAYVKTGDPLFAVAGLGSVWLSLEAYESDLPWLKFAQDVAFTVEALPGQTFHGRIAYIDPELDPMRRVVKVRVNVANERRLLKPGMFARATVDAKVSADGRVIDAGLAGKWISPMHPEIMSDEPGKCTICGMDLVPAEDLGFIAKADGSEHGEPLLVPMSAVLRTGDRAVVYVRVSAAPNPQFEGRQIVIGPRVGEYFVVDSGLEEGDLVVTRGAFKLDSELQIRARPSMMSENAGLVELPGSKAEVALLGQWEPVPRALGKLADAVKSEDEAGAREAIDAMKATIENISLKPLSPKTSALWNEFSARLLNSLASATGRELDSLATSYGGIRIAMEETGTYLGLPYQPVMTEAAAPEKLADLRAALDAYYPFVAALAADDITTAMPRWLSLLDALKKLGLEAPEPAAAKDLAAMRSALDAVTGPLIAEVKLHGLDQVGNAYVAHCPMAFDGKGADWLAPGTEIANPYFGAEMLNCGAITGNLSAATPSNTPKKTTQPTPDHSAHQP